MISKDIETLIDHINYLLIGKENYSLEVTENVQYNKNKFELQFECKLIPKDEINNQLLISPCHTSSPKRISPKWGQSMGSKCGGIDKISEKFYQ